MNRQVCFDCMSERAASAIGSETSYIDISRDCCRICHEDKIGAFLCVCESCRKQHPKGDVPAPGVRRRDRSKRQKATKIFRLLVDHLDGEQVARVAVIRINKVLRNFLKPVKQTSPSVVTSCKMY